MKMNTCLSKLIFLVSLLMISTLVYSQKTCEDTILISEFYQIKSKSKVVQEIQFLELTNKELGLIFKESINSCILSRLDSLITCYTLRSMRRKDKDYLIVTLHTDIPEINRSDFQGIFMVSNRVPVFYYTPNFDSQIFNKVCKKSLVLLKSNGTIK
jgi:hypothetical protein